MENGSVVYLKLYNMDRITIYSCSLVLIVIFYYHPIKGQPFFNQDDPRNWKRYYSSPPTTLPQQSGYQYPDLHQYSIYQGDDNPYNNYYKNGNTAKLNSWNNANAVKPSSWNYETPSISSSSGAYDRKDYPIYDNYKYSTAIAPSSSYNYPYQNYYKYPNYNSYYNYQQYRPYNSYRPPSTASYYYYRPSPTQNQISSWDRYYDTANNRPNQIDDFPMKPSQTTTTTTTQKPTTKKKKKLFVPNVWG